jgi:hypothetical protein
MVNKQYNIILMGFLSVILLIIIFNWIDLLVNKNFIVECFDTNSSEYSHSVDLPLNSKTSCNNFCGPPARCAITGQQCTSDIDCPGCQSINKTNKKKTIDIPGNDDAGKLTFNQTPQYSPLTADIGTEARIINPKKLSRTPSLNINNNWLAGFYKSEQEFNSQFKLPHLSFMPKYDTRYSLSGEFMSDGPLASNAYLN